MSLRFAPLAPSGRLRRPATRIIVVRAGPNPSFDYYLAPRLSAGGLPFEVHDLGQASSVSADPEAWSGSLVLFCRYLSSGWLDAVERHGDRIAGVALFLDDDIDALFSDWTVPNWYRFRLYAHHLRHRERLRARLDLLLVANPRIAFRYGIEKFRTLVPVSGRADEPRRRAASTPLRVAFHSSSVHAREHWWLRAVIKAAFRVDHGLAVEIVAGWPLQMLWRGLPGIQVVSPSAWPDFRAETARRGADLLVAPLLPTPANAARAGTKRLDAMRLGAALLTSDPAIYRPDEEEAGLGMCQPCEPAVWAKAIVDLARDPRLRHRLRDLNRDFVLRQNRLIGPPLDAPG